MKHRKPGEGGRPAEAWSNAPPFNRFIGFKDTKIGPGQWLIELEAKPGMLNRKGDMHGGIIAAVLDSAMGNAVRTYLTADHAGISTISFSVNYLEPAHGSLVARGHVVRFGSTIATAEATVQDERGADVARATGIFRVIGVRK
ncbi:MAG: PaaI family thioesterase [Alphaproteobacteria bacterium]